MSENPMLRIAGLANEISSGNLAAIADIQNKAADRKLERQRNEETAIDADRRFRLTESSEEGQRASRAWNDQYREEAFKVDMDQRNRTAMASGLDIKEKAASQELQALELEFEYRNATGVVDDSLNARLQAKKDEIKVIGEQKLGTLSGSYRPSIAPAPKAREYVPYPSPTTNELGFEGFGGRPTADYQMPGNLPNVPVQAGQSPGDAIFNKAVEKIGTAYKPGESARCADFACYVLDEAGYGLGANKSDLVHELNNDQIGAPVSRGDLQKGDVVYFEKTYDASHNYAETHIGIFAPNEQGEPGFIHRPTKNEGVKWDSLGEDSAYGGKLLNGRRIGGNGNLPQGGGQPDGGLFPQPTEALDRVTGDLSAYSPQQGASNKSGAGGEGSYAAAKSGPDGQATVRTLDDYVNGRSPYVTLAGNPQFNGKAYSIPAITYIDDEGNERALKNVPAVVHDTGSAFRDAPEGRFDIPIGQNKSKADMAAHHARWAADGVQFVPQLRAAPTEAEFMGPAETATPLRAEPLEQFMEPEAEQTAEIDFFDTINNDPANFAAKSTSGVNFQDAPMTPDAINLSISQPAKPAPLSAEEIMELSSRINAKFGSDAGIMRMMGRAIQERVARENPAVFDQEIEELIKTNLRSTNSKPDFSKSLPPHIQISGLTSRAMARYDSLRAVKEAQENYSSGREELDKRIKSVRQELKSEQDAADNHKAKGDAAALGKHDRAMAEAAELEAELDKLKGERSALVDPSAVTGPTPSSTGLMLQDAKAPSPTDAKKQEVLAGAYQDAPAPQKWDGLMFALGSELGIADDLLSELPLSDLNRPMPISESVFGFNLEIQATQRYVMKALHETNLRKFNKLTPKQLQIFNEAIELSVPSIRDLGQAGEMEDMVRLFGLLGLELPVRPKNETMQRKLTLAEIKNNTGVRFSLLRMLRTNSAGRAATMIRAARAQAAQSSAKRKLDKANAVLDIPQD